MKKIWWKESVVYQVYPRSFMDSNGDGIGDLKGIMSKLDYLKDLGIEVIWICPIYKSPNEDNGYDISDYQDIMDEFGTMEDFDLLLEEAHKRGLKIIMDLVINHTSADHPWFIESRSSKDNPKRDYYIWQDPKPNGEEPNNWESIFGGSAWEYDEHTEQYYMHIFAKRQPDLNWENPKVRRDLYDMVNWWLDKGIDGFRVDAISHIKKVPGFPDLPNPDKKRYVPSYKGHMNREGIHEFLDELKEETLDKYDVMTVGEANGVSAEDAELWVGEDKGTFNMIFQFDSLGLWKKNSETSVDLPKFKESYTKWQKGLEGIGWNALFLENHDVPRSVSILGDDTKYWDVSSKALATMYFLMQGTPFIYQGQEIGMTNVQFSSIDDYNDVAIKNLYKLEKENGKTHEEIMEIIWQTGRDNSRTPMQWNDEPNGGFSTGTPWLKVNPNYKDINVEKAVKDPNSIYHYYKKLIQFRKENETLLYGAYDIMLENHPQIYAYTRTWEDDMILVLTNLSAEESVFEMPKYVKYASVEKLFGNYDDEKQSALSHMKLKPYEAAVYRVHYN
ncbi:alpha-glucosidase [Bacillus ectoiniformans]|uniref:glycoside hydrolase family 13 protein n=1 Tax=Bacillus ectoiniformans TaxID=1494429 RepID=UPI0019575A8D|nr:alpha-glucosidase [Bacillus ectoiniformans]MBM7649500.1 alpha-glucosidase [Bacillus ectoiniformans]